jgi:thioredoxin 1
LKVVKIDTEKSKDFVSKYGIHGLPTFAVFKDGEAFGVQEGALGKQGLQEYILKHIPELA